LLVPTESTFSHSAILDNFSYLGQPHHFFHDWLGQHRLYLAATDLIFTHPVTGEHLHLTAEPETSFQTAFNALNWQNSPGLGD
jgi:tRNA pseudouridine65 synthase